MTNVKNPRKTFVIADIHGDVAGFRSVFKHMQDDGMDLQRDLLVQLGDMIDGYDHSREVVDELQELQFLYPNNVVVLLGNHEDFLIRAVGKHEGQSDFSAWWYQGGQATWLSYAEYAEPSEFLYSYKRDNGEWFKPSTVFSPNETLQNHIDWFETLPLYYETNDFIFVHAGLREPSPLEAQRKHDLLWIREDFHDSTYDWGKIVIYGHTAREAPLIEKNKIGLDTRWRGKGYVGGAQLFKHKPPILYKGA